VHPEPGAWGRSKPSHPSRDNSASRPHGSLPVRHVHLPRREYAAIAAVRHRVLLQSRLARAIRACGHPGTIWVLHAIDGTDYGDLSRRHDLGCGLGQQVRWPVVLEPSLAPSGHCSQVRNDRLDGADADVRKVEASRHGKSRIVAERPTRSLAPRGESPSVRGTTSGPVRESRAQIGS
jgi:hypothetical protein